MLQWHLNLRRNKGLSFKRAFLAKWSIKWTAYWLQVVSLTLKWGTKY